jgi:hypothetical protein
VSGGPDNSDDITRRLYHLKRGVQRWAAYGVEITSNPDPPVCVSMISCRFV